MYMASVLRCGNLLQTMKSCSVPHLIEKVVQNTMCNVLFFVFTFRIDPHKGNVSGKLPWGATLNHSRNNANVRPFIANKNSGNPGFFCCSPRHPRNSRATMGLQ